MAKNKGFAALAALQAQSVQTDAVEEVKVPTSVTNEDGTIVVEVPDESIQPTWDDIKPTPTLFESVEDEQADLDAEDGNPETDPAKRGESPVFTNIDELPFIKAAEPVFDAPVVEPVQVSERVLNDLPVTDWTTAELEAYIAGTVAEETYIATLKDAVREHRIREVKLPQAWTIAECRAFLLNATAPAKTTTGAWVADDTRRYRREHEWTTEELEAWALGEIKPEGSVSKAGLAIELKQRLGLTIPGVDPQAVIANYRFTRSKVEPEVTIPTPATLASVARVAEPVKEVQTVQLEGVSHVNQSYIDSSLAQFEAVMKPGRAITEKSSGEAQKLLRAVMVYAIQLPDPVGARSAMQYLLEHFRARRAIGQLFEDTYAFRGIPDMPTPKKEQVAHHDLLTLFLVYADPMVELRGQTDIPSLIAGVNPAYQSRVLEFFARQQ